MSVFRFKKFSVENDRSAMKVNTDGVLLGASMTLKHSDGLLLDIGTGTGTIALMAAQRLSDMDVPSDLPVERSISLNLSEAGRKVGRNVMVERSIYAIDIDEASADEAGKNFEGSPWPEILHARHMSLDKFSDTCRGIRFDLIFSNPPYFEDSLTAPDKRKSTARHTSDGLSYRDILDFASKNLADDGRVSLVLPAEQEHDLCRYARMNGLHIFRLVYVRTVPGKQPSRIIAEFSRSRCDAPCTVDLTIQNEGKYTSEYLSLMHEFYLFA